ncbi:AAA family ATPase [Gordonia hankookensis]|uniref:AAA family ATPase n=1 Tax=Gordonia hankookensis TaxID=589403 RepID=A0ABR7WHY5_9ACTN|nr:helix-turn-helix transcriptional regulator [Gordonia hankookensis]MBD1322370.1 AAA family ATPase [Gordonia hankookensis]
MAVAGETDELSADVDDRCRADSRALLGRTGDINRISQLLTTITAGSSESLAVVGEPGIGKTEILATAAGLGESRGCRVLHATGVEFETDIDFATLQELLLPVVDSPRATGRAWATTLRGALGLEDGAIPDIRAVLRATTRSIEELAADGPVLIVVDDLHWADAASREVLDGLAAVGPARVGILTATRDRGLSGRHEMRLEPLDDVDGAALLDAIGPSLAPSVRARLLAEAQGNPLALVDLPAAIPIEQRSGTTSLPPLLPLTHRLRDAFAPQIAALGADARLLLLLHVLQPTASVADLAAAVPDGSATGAIADATDAGVITVSGVGPDARISLCRPLFGSALLSDSTPQERTNAHRRLGRLLVRTPPETSESRTEPESRTVPESSTANGAGRYDEPRASHLERSAEAAVRDGDWTDALALFTRAAGLTPTPPDRARRLARAAYIAAGSDSSMALELIDEIRELDPGFTQSLTAASAAATLIASGHDGDIDMAHQILARAIDGYARHTDPTDEALMDAIGELRWVCWLGGREELWPAYYRALDRLTPRPPVVADLASRTSLDPARTTARTLREVDALIRGVHAETDPVQVIQIAEMAVTFDRLSDCLVALDRIVDAAEHRGPVLPAIWALLMIARDARNRGDWQTGVDAVDRARRLANGGDYNLLLWAADYEMAWLAAAKGDRASMMVLTDAMAAWAIPRRATTVIACVEHVETTAAAGRGDAEGVLAHATSISPIGEFAAHAWMAISVALDVVDAAVRLRRLDLARAHVDAMDRIGYGRLSPRMAMIHLVARALIADDEQARELYRQALAVPGATTWRFDHARALLMFGAHLRRHHVAAASRPLLTEALATFDELGARPWSDRARAELEATAATRLVMTEAMSGSLTPQERQIAELAAQGMSNKKIAERLAISHRTVGNHLHKAYRKLGVASRGGLRDALRVTNAGPAGRVLGAERIP